MKILMKGLVALIVLALIAMGVLLANINPIIEQLRPQIVSTISSTLKHPVRIGELKAKIFPTAGIEIQNVGLEGAGAEGAKLDSLIFESSLSDLLSGKIGVSRLLLKGAKVDLVKLADGSLKIGGLVLGKNEAPEAAATPTTNNPAQTAPGAGPTLAFSIIDARVSNSSFSFRDETANPASTVRLDEIELKFSAPDSIQSGMTVDLSMLMNGEERLQLQAAAALPADVLELESAVLSLFGGQITARGRLPIGPGGELELALKGQGVDLGRACAFALPSKQAFCLQGGLEALAADLRGNTSDVGGTLKGPINLRLSKGSIGGINVLGSTLGKIKDIPGIAGSLSSIVPAEHQGALTASGTAFDSLLVDGSLTGGAFELNELDLSQALYQISGSGTIGFNGSLALKTALKLTPVLAAPMLKAEPKLKLFQDEHGNLSAPVMISKQDGSVVVLPDTSAMARSAAAGAAREAIGKGLQKILPGGGKSGGLLKSLF